jgi:DNA-binding MarR family transcriptional regulator
MRTSRETADLAAELVRLSFLVQGVYAQVSARHGLTPAQAKLLCILAAGPRGMAELASALGVEKAGVTGLVDRAERHDLVTRKPVPGDRRALCVTLTTEGKEAADTFNAEVSAAIADLAVGLSAAETEAFRGAIAAINATRDAQPTLPASGY